MIGDQALQVAANLAATTVSTNGFQLTPNAISATQLRDLTAGCPLYARVTIRSDWTTAAQASALTTFAMRVYSAELVGGALDNAVYDYLIPKIGTSEPITTASLTKGRVIYFALNPQNYSNSLIGLSNHDARGNLLLFGSAFTVNAANPAAPAALTPLTGNWDLDIVMATDSGVSVVVANYQNDGPFYPTAITQV
jgi:hypothetical protein